MAPTGEQNEPGWTVPDDGGVVVRVGVGRGAGVVGRGGGVPLVGAGRGTVVRGGAGVGFGATVTRVALGRLVAVGDVGAGLVRPGAMVVAAPGGAGAAAVLVVVLAAVLAAVAAVLAAVVAGAVVATVTTVRIAAGSGCPPPVAAPITPSVTSAPTAVSALCRRNQLFRFGAGGPCCHGGWTGSFDSYGPCMVSPRACAVETHSTQGCDGESRPWEGPRVGPAVSR